MSSQGVKIPRQGDVKIIEALRALCVDLSVPAFHVQPYAWQAPINVPREGELPEEIRSLINTTSTLLYHFGLGAQGLSVNIYRGGHPNGSDFSPSAIYDELVVAQNGQPAITAVTLLTAIDKLQRKLKVFDPKRSTEITGEDGLAQLGALHSATLDRLEQVNLKLIEDQQQYRRLLDQEYGQKVTNAEAKVQSRDDALSAAFDTKNASMAAREKALEERLAEVDDRDNTHARRELRKDLQAEIKTRSASFRLSTETQKLRNPITAVFGVLITLLVFGAVWYGREFADLVKNKTTETWLLAFVGIKQAAFSIATVATSYFYIRWLNRWSETHSAAEFELRRLQLDVDRASWVVETAFEWKSSQDGELPKELLQSITRGLFEGDRNQPSEMTSPADELASALLGSASKVTLKSGETNATVEIDGKGLKKLANG
jgi:hypothetical protein